MSHVPVPAHFWFWLLNDGQIIDVGRDGCIDGYRRIAQAAQAHGCRLFGQLAHPGRANARLRDGVRAVTYSASAMPENRFKNMPRPCLGPNRT